jgi:hypothetical protein
VHEVLFSAVEQTSDAGARLKKGVLRLELLSIIAVQFSIPKKQVPLARFYDLKVLTTNIIFARL